MTDVCHTTLPPAAPQDTARFGHFNSTVTRIVAKLNATCQTKAAWLGLNSRADWSPGELRANKRIILPSIIKASVRAKKVTLPSSWDWRAASLNKVTPPKDQGRCGSAFAFAAVAAVESKLLIQKAKKFAAYPIDLSEQQVVDCVVAKQGNYRSTGCLGGSVEEPLAFASRCAVLCYAMLRRQWRLL